MQREFSFFVDHRMAGVSASLIADHDVVVLREQVHHAAFAFVAPVDADYSAVLHYYASEICSSRRFMISW